MVGYIKQVIKDHMIFLCVKMSRIGKSIKIESRLVSVPGWDWGKKDEKWLLMGVGFLSGIMKMAKN